VAKIHEVALVAKIHEVENACDTITHDIIQRLNQTFVTPIDREDVYALAKVLDDVMDAIDDGSARVPMHRVVNARAGAPELPAVILAQTAQLVLAAEHLREMSDFVPSAIREVKRLEEQADRLHKQAVRDLFDREHDAIEVIKWKELPRERFRPDGGSRTHSRIDLCEVRTRRRSIPVLFSDH